MKSLDGPGMWQGSRRNGESKPGSCKNGDPINRVRYAGGAGLEVETTEGEVPERRDRAVQYQR